MYLHRALALTKPCTYPESPCSHSSPGGRMDMQGGPNYSDFTEEETETQRMEGTHLRSHWVLEAELRAGVEEK